MQSATAASVSYDDMREKGRKSSLLKDPEIKICEDGIDGQQEVLSVQEQEVYDDDSKSLVESTWKWADTVQKRT
jgi:hypothetical protein